MTGRGAGLVSTVAEDCWAPKGIHFAMTIFYGAFEVVEMGVSSVGDGHWEPSVTGPGGLTLFGLSSHKK